LNTLPLSLCSILNRTAFANEQILNLRLVTFEPSQLGGHMDQFQFIQRENIHRYQELLGRVTDENQRQLLLKLLSEEKTKRSNDHPPKDRYRE